MSDRWLIIASGESARGTLDAVNPQNSLRMSIMTINSSWQLCRYASVHYSNDGDWWINEMSKTYFAAKGAKYCGDPTRVVKGTFQNFTFDKKSRGLDRRPGKLAWGGNSGYAGINLAVQMGAKKIVLVGYDMCGDTHWHGDHDPAVKKPFNFPMWIPRFAELAKDAQRQSVEIVNASPISALNCFNKLEINEALKWLEK